MAKLSTACITSFLFLFSMPVWAVYESNFRDGVREDIRERTLEGHRPMDYSDARLRLLGEIHLKKDKLGYYLEDVYCHQKLRSRVGPGRLPPNEKINTEHTWPQSKFNRRASRRSQKSDLHHLFPSNTQANSARGNHIFADVNGHEPAQNCDDSEVGVVDGKVAFMPPEEHKGNVARALFYFAVRYDLNISEIEEFHLRQWHLFDPVDNAEIERNDVIEQLQGNRNPFIDNPELVGSIRNF